MCSAQCGVVALQGGKHTEECKKIQEYVPGTRLINSLSFSLLTCLNCGQVTDVQAAHLKNADNKSASQGYCKD